MKLTDLPDADRKARSEPFLYALLKINDEVTAYFRDLGFAVTWDFDKQTGLHWYEIYDGSKLLVQIDFNAPLAELKTELPRLARVESETALRESATTWEVRGSLEDLRRVVARMETP